MSSAPRYYTNGRVAKSAAEEARHQGETPRGSRHPRKPQGSRAESGSRWVVELVEVELVELLFGSTVAQLALQNLDFDHLRHFVPLGAFQRQLRPRRVDGVTNSNSMGWGEHLNKVKDFSQH